MGQRRQIQKTREAFFNLGQARAEMMAAPVGERAAALAEVELQAVQTYDTAHDYYKRPVSRSVLHAAAVMAHRMAEMVDVPLTPAEG